jgi:hypothetical protein
MKCLQLLRFSPVPSLMFVRSDQGSVHDPFLPMVSGDHSLTRSLTETANNNNIMMMMVVLWNSFLVFDSAAWPAS